MLALLFANAFTRNAYLAGTAVALTCGLVGYFVVLRAQVFTGDALSHVAFTGALAALAFGFDARLGLFLATVAAGVAMALLAPTGRADDVVIGSVFAWILGLGVLFLSIYTSGQSGSANGDAGVSVLFGSIFGLSGVDALVAVVVGVGVCVGLLAMARPLLFATLDAQVAGAAGVPVRALGVGFLGLVGLTAGEATMAVGALLLLGLLAAPAAAALRLTSRPFGGLALSGALAVGSMWFGLWLSSSVSWMPPSFAIIATAVGVYAAVSLATAGRRAHGSPQAAAVLVAVGRPR
jgi:zinc/manganese transport system permease protein